MNQIWLSSTYQSYHNGKNYIYHAEIYKQQYIRSLDKQSLKWNNILEICLLLKMMLILQQPNILLSALCNFVVFWRGCSLRKGSTSSEFSLKKMEIWGLFILKSFKEFVNNDARYPFFKSKSFKNDNYYGSQSSVSKSKSIWKLRYKSY